MAQPGSPTFAPHLPLQSHPPTQSSGTHGFLRKWFGRQNGGESQYAPGDPSEEQEEDLDPIDPERSGQPGRMSRKVVPGLPRAQTFKRQQSERRDNLTPNEPSHDERRAASVDHRSRGPRASSASRPEANPRTSAPGLLGSAPHETPRFVSSLPSSPLEYEPIDSKLHRLMGRDDEATLADECAIQDSFSMADTQSLSTSQYDAMIHEELEKVWILNLSMHFRDRSKREKFFVTYRERDHVWRRVTISLDYRNAPLNSLEMDLFHTQYQREKSAKIYEAIRESLPDIQFYDSVTNLKLQTTDGRLHVHVVEDGNEVIHYPTTNQVQHLNCRRVRERDISFDSHMSGFVYKVKVDGRTLIKKEIPSPDTIDEFLYEINALSRLRHSQNVIHFYGVVVDDFDEQVKGLLIDYADGGALIDIIYEYCKENKSDISWSTREKWARQIVQGLSDIHEAGFVQGDFTLSNIVIDENNDAKIIDINRRGCPVGWEPPEATPLIKCNQRISMYIGVKSDLYQLGMVLWAIAMQDDDPEGQGRPLILGPEVRIPDWYRHMAEICLSDDPRMRLQASSLMHMFPKEAKLDESSDTNPHPPLSVDDPYTLQQYLVDDYDADVQPQIKTVEPPSEWSYVSRPYADASPLGYEPYYYTRGRSPPSPIPSHYGGYHSPHGLYDIAAWAANRDIPSSYSDVDEDLPADETPTGENASPVRPLTELTLDSTLESAKEKQEEEEVEEAPALEAADSPAEEVAEVNFGMNLSPTEPAAMLDDVERDVLGIAVVEGIERPGPSIPNPSANLTTSQLPEGGLASFPAAKPTVKASDGVVGSEYNLNESRTGTEQAPESDSKDEEHGLSTPEAEKGRSAELPGVQTETGKDVQSAKQANVEQELSAQELLGHTVPDAHAAAATETSSKTITPPSTCGPVEPTEEKSATDLEGNSSNETGSEVQAEDAKVTDSLNGIGAAHLMNNEDMMRKKQTIDEDFQGMADLAGSSTGPPPP